MGLLDDLNALVNGAQGRLDGHAARSGKTDAVKSDLFDVRLSQAMRDTVPAYADMVARFRDRPDSGPTAVEMITDVFMEFWKGDPEVREQAEMAKSHVLNHGVAETIMDAPETELARMFSVRDKYSSVVHTLATADAIEKYLDEHKEMEEKQREQQEQQDAMDAAMQALAQALGEALAAMAAANEAQGACDDAGLENFGGIGPLTEEQQALMEALAQALSELQVTYEALQEAETEAGEAEASEGEAGRQFELAVDGNMTRLSAKIRAAIEQATGDVREQMNLFLSWGLDPGDVKKMDFQERADLARLLKTSRFNKYMDYIGRTRIVGAGMKYKKVEYGREEVVGTEMSGDVTRILASEWAKMRHPMLRLQMLSDLSERRVLSKKMVGTEIVGKGAIICCGDESGSMNEPYGRTGLTCEVPMKSMMLALLDEAKRQKRDFVYIAFASPSEVKAYVFNRGNAPIEQVIPMVEHFFNGGTSYMQPLDRAVKYLREEYNGTKRMAGDIVFITDGQAPLNDVWLAQFRADKAALGFRVFGVSVGAAAGSALHRISDNVREVFDISTSDDLTDILRHI